MEDLLLFSPFINWIFLYENGLIGASQVTLAVKNQLASAGDRRDEGSILGSSPRGEHGNPLQYSCWRIPWTEEPGGLPSIGSQRDRHGWSSLAEHSTWTYTLLYILCYDAILHSLFCCLKSSRFEHLESFQLALMFLISTLFYFWSTFVFPETTRCSRLILHLPFIHFWNRPFL